MRGKKTIRLIWLGLSFGFFYLPFSCKQRPSSSGDSLKSDFNLKTTWPNEKFYNYQNLLLDIKTKKKINTVEEFLDILPKEMLSNFTLMYQTDSDQQKASYSDPRVILFHPEGSLYLTFSGTNSNNVEIISVSNSGDAFDFYKLQFPIEYNSKKLLDNSSYLPECKSCHQQDPRPNWDNYDFWKGAYGSRDDQYSWEEDEDDREETDRIKQELGYLKNFLQNRPNLKNYRRLQPPPGSPISPYRMENTQFDFIHRPNALLTLYFAQINARRIARMIQTSPLYSWSKYLIPFKKGTPCQTAIDTSRVQYLLKNHKNKFVQKANSLLLSKLSYNNWWINFMKLHGIQAKDYQLEFNTDSEELYFDGSDFSSILVRSALLQNLIKTDPFFQSDAQGSSRIEHYKNQYEKLENKYNSGTQDFSIFAKMDEILPLLSLNFTIKKQSEMQAYCEYAVKKLIQSLPIE